MTTDKSSDVLTTINNQFRELIELIDEQRTDPAMNKFEQFERFLSRRRSTILQRRKWLVISVAVLFLSVVIAYLQSTDQFLYDLYFVCLAIFRMLIIKVNNPDTSFVSEHEDCLDPSLVGLDTDLHE